MLLKQMQHLVGIFFSFYLWEIVHSQASMCPTNQSTIKQ